MYKAQNDIEKFIHKFCLWKIREAVSSYVAAHPKTLNPTKFGIFNNPDTATLRDLDLEYPWNIRIDEDSLFFDAVLDCTIEMQQFNTPYGKMTGSFAMRLIASCEAVITNKLETVNVTSVKPWDGEVTPSYQGTPASRNIVPIIHRKDLDAEATAFLEKFCPEALQRPMRVPIKQIAAEKLNLTVVQGYRLADDFSVFGQICFAPSIVKLYDLVNCRELEYEASRGTIFIDADTYSQRNIGCVNNTIAHEVYHWYRHRLYAAIKQILQGEQMIACRCPADMVYPDAKGKWTDEQTMEWQANNLAPRILMPIQTFGIKVDELYTKYICTSIPPEPDVLTRIADELARFYGVSRQSALIRMSQTGYTEAECVLQALTKAPLPTGVSIEDVFREYSANSEFRSLLDTGRFMYVSGYVVINDVKYVKFNEAGLPVLTDYGWENLSECTLVFVRQKDKQAPPNSPFTFYRYNQAEREKDAETCYQKLRDNYDRIERIHKIPTAGKTCWEYVAAILSTENISEEDFLGSTRLGKEVITKIRQNKSTPSIHTIVSIACGLQLGCEVGTTMLALAGRSFRETKEDRALRFCLTMLSSHPMEISDKFLEEHGCKALGTHQRK